MGDDKNHLYSKEDYQKDQQENAKRRTQQGFSRFSVSAATSLNDAGNTQAPEAMQIDTRNSWFREINDTFDPLSLVTVDVFFGITTGGDRRYVTYNIVTVEDDVTFAFSGTPYGKMLPFTLDITIDKPADPRPIILWSSSLVNPPTMPTLTDGLRLILHFETVRDAVSERQVYIGGTIAGSGGGGQPQTPWLSNIDADGFNLFDLSQLKFRAESETPLPIGTDTVIWSEAATGMHLNVPATKEFIIEVNDTVEYSFGSGALDMELNNLAQVDTILFINPITTISSISTGLESRIADTKHYDFLIDGVDQLNISQTAIDVNNNDIEAINRARFVNESGVVVSTDDPSIFTDSGLGLIYNAAIGTGLGHFWKNGNVTKMGLVTDVTSNTILELIAGTGINDVPLFQFLKTHPTPVTAGVIGQTQWLGTRTGDAALVSYGSISVNYENIVVGTHSGFMQFNVITGGVTDKIFLRFNFGNTGVLEVFEPLDMLNNKIGNIGGTTISEATDIITVDSATDFLLIFDASAPTTLKKVKIDDLITGLQTPWLSDIDAAGFDLFGLSNLLFQDSAGLPIGTDTAIWRENAGDLHLNVPSAKQFLFEINDTVEYEMDAGVFAVNGNNIGQVDTILFNDTVITIGSVSDGLEFRVSGGFDFDFFMGGTSEYTFTGTALFLKGNDLNFAGGQIINTGTLTLPTTTGSILSTNEAWVMANGVKAIFNPSNIVAGLNVGERINPPPNTPVNGDIYYNGTDDRFEFRENGVWVQLAGGAGNIISQGNSEVEVIDAGTGVINFQVDGTDRMNLIAGELGLVVPIDMNTNDIEGIKALEFTSNAVNPIGSIAWIQYISPNMEFNVPTANGFVFHVNDGGGILGIAVSIINAFVDLNMQDNDIVDCTSIASPSAIALSFKIATTTMWQITSAGTLNAVGSSRNIDTSGGDLDLANGDIVSCGELEILDRVRSNSSSSECGFFVRDETGSIGGFGSVQLPFDTGGDSSASQADSDFGAFLGAIGVYGRSGSDPLIVVRIANGEWRGLVWNLDLT